MCEKCLPLGENSLTKKGIKYGDENASVFSQGKATVNWKKLQTKTRVVTALAPTKPEIPAGQVRKARLAYSALFIFMLLAWSAILIGEILWTPCRLWWIITRLSICTERELLPLWGMSKARAMQVIETWGGSVGSYHLVFASRGVKKDLVCNETSWGWVVPSSAKLKLHLLIVLQCDYC